MWDLQHTPSRWDCSTHACDYIV